MNFIERKISVNKAISLLAKNNVKVNEKEADIILDFLYLIAKNNLREAQPEKPFNPKRRSNRPKST
ncbi:MAG: PTS sugar transporter subunit IIBC [Chryseobacterium sp.]|nr:MAG: PTS sugar transporter subunit IIBC [Chryseobacterium sp.]